MELIQSFWNVLAMMAPWLLVGFFLAGVVSVLLARDCVVKTMGHSTGWRGVLNAVLIGVPLPICSCGVLPLTTGLRKAGAGKGAVAGFPMYVCSTAAIPIAASLMAKGLTPGAAFVFLMVGPAINAASLATVSMLIGTRASIAYALVIALGAIACGISINALPPEILPDVTVSSGAEHVTWFEHTAAVLLVLCLIMRLKPRGSTVR